MNYIIIYLEIEHLLNFLTQEEKGDFLDLLIKYGKNQELPEITNSKLMNVFNFIKGRLDTQFEKARLKAEVAKKNGANGGRPVKKGKPKSNPDKPKITQSVIENQFEEFWNLYNYKKSKPKALAAFKSALKKESYEKVKKGLEAYIKTRGIDNKYWKHPTTWLNSECWNDDNSPTNQPKNDLVSKINEIAGGDYIVKIYQVDEITKVKCKSPTAKFRLGELTLEKKNEIKSLFNGKMELVC